MKPTRLHSRTRTNITLRQVYTISAVNVVASIVYDQTKSVRKKSVYQY